jgi:hypothetical protein
LKSKKRNGSEEMPKMWNNPIDFEKDLSRELLLELDIYTENARNRLEKREISIRDIKDKFFEGGEPDRPPLYMAEFPNKLIGAFLSDYYTDTVTHYKAYCAGVARFGEEIAMSYTFSWEYKLVERLGGKMLYTPGRAPETEKRPFKTAKDIENAPAIDLDSLVADDLAFKVYFDKRFADLIGAGNFIILDPFSQVCSLLCNPNDLLMNIVEDPACVHTLCEYMYGITKGVLKRILAVGPVIFFVFGFSVMLSPKQFTEFALPYMERLVSDFPESVMMVGSGGNATHLIDTMMKSKIKFVFLDSQSDMKVAAEKSKQYNDKPFTVLFPKEVLMRGNRDEIRMTTKRLMEITKDAPIYYMYDVILGDDVPSATIDIFLDAYNEYARYPIK